MVLLLLSHQFWILIVCIFKHFKLIFKNFSEFELNKFLRFRRPHALNHFFFSKITNATKYFNCSIYIRKNAVKNNWLKWVGYDGVSVVIHTYWTIDPRNLNKIWEHPRLAYWYLATFKYTYNSTYKFSWAVFSNMSL